MLQCVAVTFAVTFAVIFEGDNGSYSVLQCFAVFCSVLQCVAVCFSDI